MAGEPAITPPPAGDTPPPGGAPAPAPAPAGDKLPPSLIPADDPPKPPEGDAKPPADDKPPADAKPPEGEAPKPVIPEKYDFAAVQLPEGVALNSELLESITPALREAGLTQEAANKLVLAHATKVAEMQKAHEAKAEQDFQTWMGEQARAHDKAIRAEWGADYDANFQTAQRALARFFKDTGLYKSLDESGLVRHPAFMKGLLQAGKMIKEDVPPNGAANAGGRKSDAEIFYGKQS
jgi:hypothetical protein